MIKIIIVFTVLTSSMARIFQKMIIEFQESVYWLVYRANGGTKRKRVRGKDSRRKQIATETKTNTQRGDFELTTYFLRSQWSTSYVAEKLGTFHHRTANTFSHCPEVEINFILRCP